jgi:hypothetical protein
MAHTTQRMSAKEYQRMAAEKDIQAGICNYLRLKNIPYAVTDASLMVAKDGTKRRKVTTSGWPDVTAVLTGGQFLGIETKTAKGVLSADQIACHKSITDMGGIVIVPRSLEDAMDALRRIGAF